MGLFFGGNSIGELIDVLLPFIILYMFMKAVFPEGFGIFSDIAQYAMIQKRRLKNEVKNDGTDRDYMGLVRSCRAYRGYAKILLSDTQGDRDLRSIKWGRIIGISPRLTFTAILLRVKWYNRPIMLLCPNEFLSTLDRPEIRIKARAPINLAEYFWFPEPLRSSRWGKDEGSLNLYWQKCYQFLDEISKKRMSIDAQGDMDFQVKCSQRNKPEEARDEIINELKKNRRETDTEDLNHAPEI